MFRFPFRLVLINALLGLGVASGQEPPRGREHRDAGSAPPAGAAETGLKQAHSTEGVAFFERKIRPVLVAECYDCHSQDKGKKLRGGLALDSREATRKGGESGPAIMPGSPAKSLLMKAMSHSDPKLAMPPKKKLDASIIRDFEE